MIKKTPPMGFNTWNTFGECFYDHTLREVADALVDRGFKDAGYEYLIIDDHWNMENRDSETHRMTERPGKFPNGLTPVIDYVHSKDLKMGIYSCAGVRTCGVKMGSFDYEFLDAKTFAEWGIDYLKYDFCLRPELLSGEMLYRRMGLALRHSGRDILFAACNWGSDDVWSWARSAGAHTYRSTGDIADNFKSFTEIFRSQLPKLGSSCPGCQNDLDMMTVGMEGAGNVASGNDFGTEGTYRMQFCVWCMFSSPLILGCDVRSVSDKYRDLLCNRELIRINQDPECRPAFPIGYRNQGYESTNVYCKLLTGGEFAILFLNVNDGERNMGFIPHDIGICESSGYRIHMTDLFTGEEFEENDFVSLPVPARDCRIFRAKLVK